VTFIIHLYLEFFQSRFSFAGVKYYHDSLTISLVHYFTHPLVPSHMPSRSFYNPIIPTSFHPYHSITLHPQSSACSTRSLSWSFVTLRCFIHCPVMFPNIHQIIFFRNEYHLYKC
jgi:hypothetical protein